MVVCSRSRRILPATPTGIGTAVGPADVSQPKRNSLIRTTSSIKYWHLVSSWRSAKVDPRQGGPRGSSYNSLQSRKRRASGVPDAKGHAANVDAKRAMKRAMLEENIGVDELAFLRGAPCPVTVISQRIVRSLITRHNAGTRRQDQATASRAAPASAVRVAVCRA